MGKENLTNKAEVNKVRNICPSSMADSDPRFTTRPFTRANSSMCRSNYSTNNYMRSVCKLLFFTFFLIAIPLFPSQAPAFINQTIFNQFWELVHLMFIGIAVSYGLFCRRSVDFDNVSNLEDSQSCVPSIFEDGCTNSLYYRGQGKDGFFDVKNGSFENPYEENVVQAWSSKYFQGKPKVVVAQPNCGIEKYGESESSSFVDYKPLGLPVRSLKSRVVTQVSPEFGNGSSESSGSHMNDSSDSYNKSRSGRYGDLGSEDLEGKFNESDVLGSPIPWRSRSGRRRERVHSNVTRPSHFRPHSVDETQFDSLKLRSLQSTVSISSQVSSQSHSPSSLSPSHSSSSESPKSQMSELVTERSPRRSFPPPPSVPKPMSSKASVNASHSRSGRMRERVHSNVTRSSHIRPLSVDETQFESLKSQYLRSTVSFSSQIGSQSHSPSSLSPSHSSSSESPESKMSEMVKERSPRQSFPPSPSVPKPMSSKSPIDATQFESLKTCSLRSTVSFSPQVSSQSHSPSSLSPSHSSSSESPKSKTGDLVKEKSPRRSFPTPSPSVSKTKSIRASVNASDSRQYSDGSLLKTPAWECFKVELKEFCDSKKDKSSGSFKFDAKPETPSKASSRGKSVRTFRSFRASVRARDAGEKQEDCTKGKLTMGSDEIDVAYLSEREPKIEGHNNLPVGFDRQNHGGESHMPKPTSPENQKREHEEDSERENADSEVSSDEETMSGTFSIAGSEVDRKAGEFIAKFKEQIRLQRATSIDTPRGLNMTGNYFG